MCSNNVGLTCDTASEQQVIQMKEKAQKLLQEYSTVQGSRSRSRKHSQANVEDRMRSCLTMLINKAEELEFEESIKFQDQGLGKPDRLIPFYYHTMTQEGWLQTTATEVTRLMHATMVIDIRNICKSHTNYNIISRAYKPLTIYNENIVQSDHCLIL